MKRFSKEKMAGMAGTLLVHAAVAALLYFLVLTPPAKLPEKGVEVMMGIDIENFAMEQFNEVPPVASVPAQVEPAPPTPEEPLITQDSEESLVLPPEKPKKEKQKPKKQEKTPEQIKKEKEEAERKERERKEAEARKAAESSIANAFNKGFKMNKKGDAENNEKASGSPQGNSNSGQQTGVGVSFSLSGRNVGGDGLTRPTYNVQAAGRVVVDITVAPNGKVVSVSINPAKSNTADPALRTAALAAARKTVFNSIGGVDNQRGTITYNFELTK